MITHLVLHDRRRGRVNVFVDGRFAFDVAAELATDLRRGQCLTTADITGLQARDATAQGIAAAMKHLARKPRSRHETMEHLLARDFPPATCEAVCDRLASNGYLDDDAFASWWIDNRSTHRPRGAFALRQELKARGVPSSSIEAALDGFDELPCATKLARAGVARHRHLGRQACTVRVGGQLQRRGFEWSTIRAALDAAWASAATT